MKKYLYLALAALLAVLSLTACGGSAKPKEVTISVSDLSKQLTESVNEGMLSSEPAVTDIVASTYFLDMEKIEDSSTYLSTAASASEVSVVLCKDSSYTAEVESLFKSRVKSQSDLYASYAPDEAKKLDASIIKTSGNYVVLCVADDKDKANDILEKAGF